MVRSLWTGASGMIGQQFNIDTISHNLSNVNTTGFKKTRAEFEDLLYQNLRMAGTPSTSISNYPTGIHVIQCLGANITDADQFFGGTKFFYNVYDLTFPSTASGNNDGM